MKELKFDLNELVSDEISEQIENLEVRIEDLSNENTKLRAQNHSLTETNNKTINFINLFDKLIDSYKNLKPVPEDKDGWGKKYLRQVQFEYIENILLNFFNIKKEYERYYDGRLEVNLAVNFYNHKDIVISILKCLVDNPNDIIKFIKNFKMPYDYSKEEIIDFCKNPKYNTNGEMYGVSRYWVEYGASKTNMPHDLIMKSPYILEEDVFNIILDTIKKSNSNFYYLYALPKYADCTIDQIQQLGETLLNISNSVPNYDVVTSFIKNQLVNFNDKSLEWLYEKATSSNQFNLLHWENFPIKYQKKFLMKKSISEILKILNEYHCKWSDEDKENFIVEYSNSKNK